MDRIWPQFRANGFFAEPVLYTEAFKLLREKIVDVLVVLLLSAIVLPRYSTDPPHPESPKYEKPPRECVFLECPRPGVDGLHHIDVRRYYQRARRAVWSDVLQADKQRGGTDMQKPLLAGYRVGSRNGHRSVPVDVVHPSDLDSLVVVVVLDDAQAVDPDEADPKLTSHGYSISDRVWLVTHIEALVYPAGQVCAERLAQLVASPAVTQSYVLGLRVRIRRRGIQADSVSIALFHVYQTEGPERACSGLVVSTERMIRKTILEPRLRKVHNGLAPEVPMRLSARDPLRARIRFV